jgi:hypothetical protein
MEQKVCRACSQHLPTDAFYNNGRNICKKCWRAAVTARRQKFLEAGCCGECAIPIESGTLCTGCKKIHLDRYYANRDRYCEKARDRRKRLKLAACNAYGGAVCACCQESHIEFLSIDHINGDGAAHRRSLVTEKGWKSKPNAFSGSHFYLWLKKNKYPPGFRVLCYNCNFSLGHFGYCPHGGIVGGQMSSSLQGAA